MVREHREYFAQHEAIVEVEEGDFLSDECFNWCVGKPQPALSFALAIRVLIVEMFRAAGPPPILCL